jgi:hypothetical protein
VRARSIWTSRQPGSAGVPADAPGLGKAILHPVLAHALERARVNGTDVEALGRQADRRDHHLEQRLGAVAFEGQSEARDHAGRRDRQGSQ